MFHLQIPLHFPRRRGIISVDITLRRSPMFLVTRQRAPESLIGQRAIKGIASARSILAFVLLPLVSAPFGSTTEFSAAALQLHRLVLFHASSSVIDRHVTKPRSRVQRPEPNPTQV